MSEVLAFKFFYLFNFTFKFIKMYLFNKQSFTQPATDWLVQAARMKGWAGNPEKVLSPMIFIFLS